MSTAQRDEWLSAHDVAERLRVSLSSARAVMRRLPRLKLGRISRVRAEDLEALLAANVRQPRQLDNTLESQLRSAMALVRSYEAAERAQRRSTPTLSSGAAPSRIRATRPREAAPEPPPIRHTRQPPKLPL
jgi:hypothetical protein